MENYTTPLYDALEQLQRLERVRFHMPGHKGRLPEPLGEAAIWDITEVEGADSLYEADDALLALENRMSNAYGSAMSLLSAGGSTLCIQTMLYLARRRGRKLIIGRNCHRAAVSAMGLLGLEPIWLHCPTASGDPYSIDGIAMQPDPAELEELLYQNPDTMGVYITSPDYFGQMADISAISELCHRYGVKLLVDNAHGAHLNRFRAAMHPIQLGADFCCDSLHKTLPVLTGGAVLHLSDEKLYDEAKYAMSLFGSSSPSYLIMLSADMALPQMETGDNELMALGGWIGELKERLAERGYQTIRSFVCDPIKLAVGFHGVGYTGEEFAEYLHIRGIEPEYVSGHVAVFMPSPQNTGEELILLERALMQMPLRPALAAPYQSDELPRQPLSIEGAMKRPHILLPVDAAHGRIAARLVSHCPPGTPLVVPGEEITDETIFALKSSGIEYIYVVK